MAEHHTEAALKLLESWRAVLDNQAKAIEQGDMKLLEGFIKESATIQHQLQQVLSSSKQLNKDRTVAELMRDLHREQGTIIVSLHKLTEELSREIISLRKHKDSLAGYKQKNDPSPSFLNKRT